MDATAQKLIQLLDRGDLDLRMAAMRVISELGVASQGVVRSLGRALREEPQALKLLALKGLKQLGARDVIAQVIPLLGQSGEIRDRALEVIGSVGEGAVAPLESFYSRTDHHGKRGVATALSRIGSAKTVDFLLAAIQRESFELQKHFSQCLCETIDERSPGKQLTVFNQIQKFLASPSTAKDIQAQVIGIILLGHFRGERQVQAARRLLCAYGGPKQPPEIRRYALIALNGALQEAPPKPDLVAFLEKSLCDPDWNNVAQHALLAFQRLDLPQPRAVKLLQLLKSSPHYSVHIHVFERLAQVDRPDVAKAIIPFIADARYRVREVAEKALRSMPTSIVRLLAILGESDDMDLCRRVHSILMEYPKEARRKELDGAISRFLRLFDRNDRRYQFFLDFARAVDPEPLRKRIYERVESYRKGKSKDRWLTVSRFLQVLWDQHLITPEGRYLFAVALIKLDNKDLSPHARHANLGLQVIRSLIYDDTPGLVTRLTGSRDLDSDDLFYIGFHFVEEGEELRPFATSLLEYIAKKYAKSNVATVARQKLDLVAEEIAAAPPRGAKGRRRAKARGRGAVAFASSRSATGSSRAAASRSKPTSKVRARKSAATTSAKSTAKGKASTSKPSAAKSKAGAKSKPARKSKSSSAKTGSKKPKRVKKPVGKKKSAASKKKRGRASPKGTSSKSKKAKPKAKRKKR